MQTHIQSNQTHVSTRKHKQTQTHIDTVIGDDRTCRALWILGGNPEIEERINI